MIKKILSMVLMALVTTAILFLGFPKKEYAQPKEVYQVYLDGKKIGLIASETGLETYINEQQKEIKETYGVENVFMPNNLEIEKVITYNEDILTPKELYEQIKEGDSFTIEGFRVVVTGSETEDEIYVLNKEIFEEAIETTIEAFVTEEEYAKYVNSSQDEIETTGKTIEEVKIDQEIELVEEHISINKTIFETPEDLAKYMLYGTIEEQETYVVKAADNVSQIAFNHKLSEEEFLVANPEFNSADVILSPGQVVNIGLIDPRIDVVEEVYLVEDEVKKFETEIVYDDTKYTGYSEVTREGENGLTRVSKRLTKVNGVITNVEIIGTEELKPSISKVILEGNKFVPNVGILNYWYWPTRKPYVITSPYGYRWGKFHRAIDIAGCGYDSDLYSANNGTVYKTAYDGDGYGKYIIINHNNGYYTLYSHMSRIDVKEGQDVRGGQVIGGMGNTGFVVGVTGVHLHFEIWIGKPFVGGRRVNPLNYY